MDFLAVRADMGVDHRARADIAEVDGFGEKRLHRGRAGIVDIPLDFRRGPQPALEPTFPFAAHV